MAAVRKGQVFIIGAVIIGSLLFVTALSYQEVIITESDTNYRFYFQSALEQQSKTFNSHISQENSITEVRNGMYSFNSFLDAAAEDKGINYQAFQLVILPEKDKAMLINYRDSSTPYRFYYGSWSNSSLESGQYTTIDLPEEQERFGLISNELDVSENFLASTPKLLAHVEMSSGSTVWRNHVLS